MNHWQLSPIVGEVRNNKASVIFELYNKTYQVEYTINNVNSINKTKVNVEPVGPTKVILNFEEGGNYIVRWFVNDVLSRMHNILISNNIDKLIFVSCDLLEADTENSLWEAMIAELSLVKKVGIVHLGDQAYMDSVFNCCKKYIEQNKDISTEDINNMCFEAYGKRYCDTWMPHRTILANASNYYIWDDHEITNNVVLNDIIDDTTKIISKAAVNAYNLYQQSFHVEETFIINEYCWYKYIDIGKTTVMLAIERTSREISINEIFNAIKILNDTQMINRLILCFTSAPIPIPNNNNYGKTYVMLKGLGKFWEQQKIEILYTLLFDWMNEQEGREIIVVGGDIHFGVHGHVKKDNLIIPVLIASPITNQPYPDRVLASKGMKGEHNIDPNGKMKFVTLSTKARRCYGVLDLDSVPMTTNIIYSRDKYPRDICKYIQTISEF